MVFSSCVRPGAMRFPIGGRRVGIPESTRLRRRPPRSGFRALFVPSFRYTGRPGPSNFLPHEGDPPHARSLSCRRPRRSPVLAQGPPDPAATIAAQRDALRVFASLDGVWRGPAWTLLPSGEKHTVTQTERIGPFLDGSVKVVEG